MVTSSGFKPENAAVKGRCVKSLHQLAMAATVRFELTTNRLTAGCSTAELSGHAVKIKFIQTLYNDFEKSIKKFIFVFLILH